MGTGMWGVMKPYKYTGRYGGRYDTRHEAVGKESIKARRESTRRAEIHKLHDRRMDATLLDAVSSVYAYRQYVCGYCHEPFLYEYDYEDHTPCPEYEADEATQPTQHSNPVEWESQ